MSQLNQLIQDLEELLDGKRMSESEYETYRKLMKYLYTLDDMHQMFMASAEAESQTLQ
jgi:hypothetical protein